MSAIYAEDFDCSRCDVPGCTCISGRVVSLAPDCHKARDSALRVKYDRLRGVLGLFCAICGAHAGDIAVARRAACVIAIGRIDGRPS